MLYAQMTAANADWGGAVVMDPRTGEVLAQASYPSYDADACAELPAGRPEGRGDAARSSTRARWRS